MSEPTTKEVIQAAASVLIDAALAALQTDNHYWSTRPCDTCRFISGIRGKPFGCYEYARQQQAAKRSSEDTSR